MISEGATVVVNMGELFKLRLKAEGPASIHNVKEAVEESIGIPVARQTLTSSGSQVELDSPPLTDGVIVLFLTVTPLPPHTKFNVTVSHHYKGFPYREDFEVQETDTVIQLKQKVRASKEFDKLIKKVATAVIQDHFLPKHLKLMRRRDLEMIDDDPLSKYYIHDGCIIDMFITKPEVGSSSTSTTPN